MVVPGSANQVVTAILPMLPHGLLLALADLRKRRLR
jgi:phage tail protein X